MAGGWSPGHRDRGRGCGCRLGAGSQQHSGGNLDQTRWCRGEGRAEEKEGRDRHPDLGNQAGLGPFTRRGTWGGGSGHHTRGAWNRRNLVSHNLEA